MSMFFENMDRHGGRPAIHDLSTGQIITYAQLEKHAADRAAAIGQTRKLVFLEARNNAQAVIDYLACLKGKHVVYLLDNLDDEKTKSLINLYKPNTLIGGNGEIRTFSETPLDMHPDLAVLLSTSGSTGSPKFVKLSARNIQANARSICEYLGLNPDERALSHLKPHYSYGMSVLNSHLDAGATILLTLHNVIDPGFWTELKEHRATSFAGVPYTFETLLRSPFNVADYPTLKSVTQAGGKLEPALVKKFSGDLAKHGAKFFVMYGQTEAAPRIAWLPPELTAQYPHVIGRAIPGGHLSLIDENGVEIHAMDTPGELVYRGPNVMMGYATAPEHLSSDETPESLLTGDIACRTDHDLFYIVGRTKRFVKPFGLRIGLDEIQSYVKTTYGQAAVAGTDSNIVIAMEQPGGTKPNPAIIPDLARRYGLPESIFAIRLYEELPLMTSGKHDYNKILNGSGPARPTLLRRIVLKVADIFEWDNQSWASILDLYRTVLAKPDITPDDNFSDLGADSLSFVSLSIGLEDCLGKDLPADWQNRAIRDLETIYERVRFA